MKTNMFKKLSKEGKRNKFIGILSKKTNRKITDDIIKCIMSSIDMENQYKIDFYDMPDKFTEACRLTNVTFDKTSSVMNEKEEVKVLYGDLNIDKNTFDNNQPQVFLKILKRMYRNDTTEWYYSLVIYIPEEK